MTSMSVVSRQSWTTLPLFVMWYLRLGSLSRRLFLARTTRRSARRFSGGGGSKSVKVTSNEGQGGWGWGLWALYVRELEKRPVITKMWTSGCINATGDIIAQNLFSEKPFDWNRLFVFTNLGIFMIGPALHYWYGILHRLFSSPGLRTAMSSLLLDQVGFAPVLCATILSTLSLAETGKISSVKPKLDQDWWPTLLMNWRIWVPAQLINFWIVPPSLRVLFANMVALIWTTYLSYASHKRVHV